MRVPVAQQYRRKPTEVTAMYLGNQTTDHEEQAIVDWIRDSGGRAERSHGAIWLRTPGGWVVVDPDTYVVRGEAGDFSISPTGVFSVEHEQI